MGNMAMIILYMLLMCLISGVRTNCSKDAISTFNKEAMEKPNQVAKLANKLSREFPDCFFKETKSADSIKKCQQNCGDQYNACDAAVPAEFQSLKFPCHTGYDGCMNKCQPNTGPTRCKEVCKNDFRNCFLVIKAYHHSFVCTASRKYCKVQTSCYRKHSPVYFTSKFRL